MSQPDRPTSQMLYLRAKTGYTVGIDLKKCSKVWPENQAVRCERENGHKGQHKNEVVAKAWR